MSKNNTIKKSDKKFIRREKARIRNQFLDYKKQEELISELYKRFLPARIGPARRATFNVAGGYAEGVAGGGQMTSIPVNQEAVEVKAEKVKEAPIKKVEKEKVVKSKVKKHEKKHNKA